MSNLVKLASTIRLVNLKSATKPLNVLIAFTRPLIAEFADNLNLKHPLLPTISPYPTISSEAIDNEPILFKSLKKNDWSTFPSLFHISETKEHSGCSLLLH